MQRDLSRLNAVLGRVFNSQILVGKRKGAILNSARSHSSKVEERPLLWGLHFLQTVLTGPQPVDSHTISATTITPRLNAHIRRLRLNIDDL